MSRRPRGPGAEPAPARHRRLASFGRAALTIGASSVLLGCGLGAGRERDGGAELRVTRDFGQARLASARLPRVREGQSVMRLLQENRDVETRYGGRFVESIDGLAGSTRHGRRDWFYFVNGIEADAGAADRELSPGDVVQWDYRRWDAAISVPAIVGAYPEPFRSGVHGKRLPTRVECEDEEGAACREVNRRLTLSGITPNGAPLGSAVGAEALRVVVAKWRAARDLQSAATLERGPGRSGVYARFAGAGSRLELLDDAGRAVRQAPPGTGLLAATRQPDRPVVWFVTGLDAAGVEAAATALDERTLTDAFAVAVTPEGPVRLPVIDESGR